MKKIFTVIISLLLIYCSKGGDASTENLSLSTPVSSNTNANSSNDSSDTNETTDTEQTSDSDESSTNDQTSSTEESANTSEVKILDISGGCTKFIGNGPKGEWFNFVEGSQEEAHAHFIYTANDGGIIQVGETGFLDNNTAIPEDSLLYTLSPCAFKDCMLGVSILLISNECSPTFPIFLKRSTLAFALS